VPQLAAQGHQVTATTTSTAKLGLLERLGAEAVVMDGLDAVPVIRLRTEGTDHLLAAAEAAGVSHVVAQGYANWNGIREGGWVKTEEDRLDPMTGTAADASMAALCHVADVVGKAGGTVMRYGALYGPGATDDQVELLRKRRFPLVGRATGYGDRCALRRRRPDVRPRRPEVPARLPAPPERGTPRALSRQVVGSLDVPGHLLRALRAAEAFAAAAAGR
jgi:nucleoside-diphosphate-sugar epimerase